MDNESMKDLQNQVPERMQQSGVPAPRPRLAQARRGQTEEGQPGFPRPRPPTDKFAKWLPWIATGSAAGGGLALTYFDFLA